MNSAGARAARLPAVLPAAGMLLVGARASVILAVAGLAAVILTASGILSPWTGISRILAARILAARVGHSGARPARVWSTRILAARVGHSGARPALSANAIAAVGRHPGGDIDGPVPLLGLRRRRWGHN